ncbi:MAG: hypothetical protein ABH880_02070 [Patescibacteria group bacterium]
MIWIIVIILLFIWFGIDHSNRLKKFELIDKEKRGKEEELNELLRHNYPHLYYNFKEELLSFHEAKEFYKNRPAILGSPFKDMRQVANWRDAAKLIKFDYPNNKNVEKIIDDVRKYTLDFARNVKESKEITEHELEFVSYEVWGTLYSELERYKDLNLDGNNPNEAPIVSSMAEDWFEEYLIFLPDKKLN